MKLKIIISFLVLCNITISAQNNEYKEQIGEKFYELGLKTKLKKVDEKDIYKLNYIGFQKMDNMGLNGVNIINNLKTLKKLRGDNYITYTETELFLNEKYQNTNPAQRVAYSYTISQMGTESNVFDTLIVFNIVKNINGENITMPFAFLMSDYRLRDKNVVEYNQRKQQQIYEKKIQLIDNAFSGNEKLIFPNDSIYIYCIQYKNLERISVNALQNSRMTGYGGLLVHYQSLQLAVSNENNIELIKGEVELENIDSIWLVNQIYYKDLYAKNEIAIELITSATKVKDYFYTASYNAINDLENFNEYNNLSYWIKEADLYLENKISTSTIYLQLSSSGKSINLEIKEDIELLGSTEAVHLRNDYPLGYGQTLTSNVMTSAPPYGLVLFDKTYDIRVDDINSTFVLFMSDFKFNKSYSQLTTKEKFLSSYPTEDLLFRSVTPYGFTKQNVVKYFAYLAFDRFQSETESNQEAVEAKKKEEEEVKKLYKKYGKKYVDAALDFDIIVGMHEDLLPYPLKLWSIKSRSDFKNGYDLYLYSMLDTSVHLYITVRNHKVSYVSVW
jgi:hypothetical protein